jgi:hypothetical protein
MQLIHMYLRTYVQAPVRINVLVAMYTYICVYEEPSIISETVLPHGKKN